MILQKEDTALTVHSGRLRPVRSNLKLKNAGTARKKLPAFSGTEHLNRLLLKRMYHVSALPTTETTSWKHCSCAFCRGRADRLPQELRAFAAFMYVRCLIFRGTALKNFLKCSIFTGVPTVQTAIQGIFAT